MKVRKLSILLLALCFSLLGLLFPLPVQHSAKGFYCDTTYTSSGGTSTDISMEFEYDSYTLTDVHLNLLLPAYGSVGKSNACACVAGTVVIGYYDATLPELIPNFEPGIEYEGIYYFHGNTFASTDLESELYDLMGTNTIAPGTNVTQFKNGMNSYVNGKGYDISYNSCGNKFNTSTAINYFNQQMPVVLFLNTYEFYTEALVQISSTKLRMLGRKKEVGHVVVALGYRQYKFYKNNNLFRTEEFLLVAFGDDTLGYLDISNLSYIDESYAIKIY